MPRLNRAASEIPFYLTKKVSEMAATEPGSVNLSRGQAGFLPPPEVYDEARRLIRADDRTLFRYELSAGSAALRGSIARWYGRLFDVDVDPAYVAVTVGGTGAISLALQTFSDYGDQIVVPDPAYPFYMLCAQYGLDGREVTRVHIGTSTLEPAQLADVIKETMRIVVITSPHNPTGVVYDEGTLKGLLDLARARDFLVVYDENHFPEVYDGRRHLPIQGLDEGKRHSLTLGSLSRLALQGERIGWAVLPRISKDVAAAYVAQTPFASTFAQKLAMFVLDHYEELGFDAVFRNYEQQRNLLIAALDDIPGWRCQTPAGSSYAFVNIRRFVDEHRAMIEHRVRVEAHKRKLSAEEIDLTLSHNSILVSRFLLYCVGVGVVPGIAYGPGSDDFIRLTFSVERHELETAIQRLRSVPIAVANPNQEGCDAPALPHQASP